MGSPAWTIAMNAVAWLAVHLGTAYSCSRMPHRWFDRATTASTGRRTGTSSPAAQRSAWAQPRSGQQCQKWPALRPTAADAAMERREPYGDAQATAAPVALGVQTEWGLCPARRSRLARGAREEQFYERALRIRSWKDRVPELGDLFPGGLSKQRLYGYSREALLRFAAETRRGELTHWLAMLPSPLFFLWNSAPSGWLMVGYALAANLPFIAIQRYNRRRLLRVVERRRT
ncbi:hypothetical protein [Paenibacillus sp. SYP-B4298]|uniref:glycosyl-4,4'-diaponeurosporenoate acyltransferase CrtO family protein n=1 Tax=Paenibacillus sp. SYP-B4298 TaxID=2996034 RepID=UPI0022DD1D82|nr:hypothetical protein [Paenibacillus sp. SYP-B4298]